MPSRPQGEKGNGETVHCKYVMVTEREEQVDKLLEQCLPAYILFNKCGFCLPMLGESLFFLLMM